MAQPNEADGTSPFAGWLKSFPVLFSLAGAALAAVLGLLAPDRLVPEPLQGLKPVVSVYVVATFFLAWAWRRSLERRLKHFATVTFLLAALFAVLNVLFVRPVSYQREAGTVERHFVTGLTPMSEQDRGRSAEDLIKTYGDSWEDLVTIWGDGFIGVAITYAMCYLLLILGVVFSMAASDLVKSRKRKT
jgi:hypothetical protein